MVRFSHEEVFIWRPLYMSKKGGQDEGKRYGKCAQ
jgi:hypothetical protein